MTKLSIRLSPSDTQNIVTIAAAMHTDRQPFITRSAAIRLALTTVAADPERFVKEAKGVTR